MSLRDEREGFEGASAVAKDSTGGEEESTARAAVVSASLQRGVRLIDALLAIDTVLHPQYLLRHEDRGKG